MISIHLQGKPFNITVIQVYAPTTNAKEVEVERFYEDLQDLLELTPKKRCLFHHRGLECKSRKSRDNVELTGKKARGLQKEEVACKCQTFLSLLSGRRKPTSNIFFLLSTTLKGGFS